MIPDVVIPTWNAAELLGRCLRALAEDPSPKRTVVVDNGSADATLALLRDEFPDVVVVALERNVGFGRAVNAGVRAGDGEAVVLLNNDVLVEPGFVTAITQALEDPRAGMVAGLTLIPGDGTVDAFGIELDRGLAAYNRGRHGAPGGPMGRLAMPSGGAAAYRRTAWEAIGGFDEALFAYGEDVDLGLRLRAAGWTAAEAPGARGVHLGGASVGVDSPFQRELAAFARGFLLGRWASGDRRALLRAIVVDAAVIGWGLVRHRTVVPLTGRVRGWRAAGGRHTLPAGVVDERIGTLESLRRLVSAR
jgi:N-acetylglucosaminyl-diphospho-decaprenol L-rhamnosyltransferase